MLILQILVYCLLLVQNVINQCDIQKGSCWKLLSRLFRCIIFARFLCFFHKVQLFILLINELRFFLHLSFCTFFHKFVLELWQLVKPILCTFHKRWLLPILSMQTSFFLRYLIIMGFKFLKIQLQPLFFLKNHFGNTLLFSFSRHQVSNWSFRGEICTLKSLLFLDFKQTFFSYILE